MRANHLHIMSLGDHPFLCNGLAGPGLHRVRRWAERTATWTKKRVAAGGRFPDSTCRISKGHWMVRWSPCKLTASPCFEELSLAERLPVSRQTIEGWHRPGQWWLCLIDFVTIQRDISLLLKGPLSPPSVVCVGSRSPRRGPTSQVSTRAKVKVRGADGGSVKMWETWEWFCPE